MLFPALPDASRLWLRALAAPPAPAARALLREGLDGLMGQWRHKGVAYRGAWALLHDQIIAVAEPTLASAPSGCAIDGMLRKLERLADTLALPCLYPSVTVLARLPEGLTAIAKADLAEALAQGRLTPATPILDLALYTLGDLRAGHLEVQLSATWIARKYPMASQAS